GIKDIVVVRGYRKDAVTVESLRYFDNDEAESTGEAFSLHKALPALEGGCVISYGDVLFKKYIVEELTDLEADFAVAVDTSWREEASSDPHTPRSHAPRGNARRDALRPVSPQQTLHDLGSEAVPATRSVEEPFPRGAWEPGGGRRLPVIRAEVFVQALRDAGF